MSRNREYDYLGASYQLEAILEKKTAVYSNDAEIRELHQKLITLGRQVLEPDCPREREYDYLAASQRIQELLQERAQSYSLLAEFEPAFERLVELGRELGYEDARVPEKPAPEWKQDVATDAEVTEMSQRLNVLQQQIEQLRAAFS